MGRVLDDDEAESCHAFEHVTPDAVAVFYPHALRPPDRRRRQLLHQIQQAVGLGVADDVQRELRRPRQGK